MSKTPKQRHIQLIHIAKSQLGIDNDTYRQLLINVTGKDSTTKMSLAELSKVLFQLEQKGFKKRYKRKTVSSKNAKYKSRIALKIRAIWIDMDKSGYLKDGSDANLNAWVRKTMQHLYPNMSPVPVGVQALDNHDASIVLERIKKWQKRCQNKAAM